jgi:hypothetical protein
MAENRQEQEEIDDPANSGSSQRIDVNEVPSKHPGYY